MINKVLAARTSALEAIDQYLEGDNNRSAWDMPAEIAKKRGWTWARESISGKEYAALMLMLNALVKE